MQFFAIAWEAKRTRFHGKLPLIPKIQTVWKRWIGLSKRLWFGENTKKQNKKTKKKNKKTKKQKTKTKKKTKNKKQKTKTKKTNKQTFCMSNNLIFNI